MVCWGEEVNGVSGVILTGPLGKPMLRRGPLNQGRRKGGHTGNLNDEKCSSHGGTGSAIGSPKSSFGFFPKRVLVALGCF